MKSEEIALPWFPITPDYIDQYHESVLKYLRDAINDRSQDLSNDSSYMTTIGLLLQRAEQISSELGELPLQEASLRNSICRGEYYGLFEGTKR